MCIKFELVYECAYCLKPEQNMNMNALSLKTVNHGFTYVVLVFFHLKWEMWSESSWSGLKRCLIKSHFASCSRSGFRQAMLQLHIFCGMLFERYTEIFNGWVLVCLSITSCSVSAHVKIFAFIFGLSSICWASSDMSFKNGAGLVTIQVSILSFSLAIKLPLKCNFSYIITRCNAAKPY